MIATDRLLELFVDATDTLIDDYDLIEFMHRLADGVVEVTGGTAVGLLLADNRGQLQYMASSHHGVESLELFQLQNDDGPCLDCYRTGAAVVVADLSTAQARWPHFTVAAAEQGFASVHAFPLRLRDRVIGALNVFGRQSLPLAETDIKIVQALADVATIAIIQERAVTAAETLTEQLQGALNSRVVIEQAKGMVARSNAIGVDEAFDLLRHHARSEGLRLTSLARDVVERTVDPVSLGPRPSSP